MSELGERLRAAIEPTLEPGEQLRGISVATQQSMFKGRMVGIAVTDHRLILQGVSRKFEPNCEPISLPPERIAEAKAEGAGGGWPQLSAALMDEAAVTLKLKTTDGEKLKLMMMRGSGPLAGLGGGDDQRQGVEALGAWFAEHDSG
jgi:hypothetical protein